MAGVSATNSAGAKRHIQKRCHPEPVEGSVEWAGSDGLRGPRANDRLLPTPHQTGQAVFPHPAFRVPFSGSGITDGVCGQFIESIGLVQFPSRPACESPGGVAVLAPQPLSETVGDE